MTQKKLDLFQFAQRLDIAMGVIGVLVAVYLLVVPQSYDWAAWAAAGAVLSFASAKFVPAKWILRRLLLARTR